MSGTTGIRLLTLLALSLLATLAGAAEFKVEMVTRTQGSSMGAPASVTYCVKGVKQRQEYKSASGETTHVIILRPDRGVYWLVVPQIKTSHESPMPKSRRAAPVVQELRRQLTSFKRVGSETIKGYPCDKYQGTMAQGSVVTTVTSWVSASLNLALKTEVRTHAATQTTEVRSISVKPQPDSLFEIPAGYRRLVTDAGKGAAGGKAAPGR